MAYDGWVSFDGVELINLSRSVLLAQALGIDTLWVSSDSVAWIGPELDETSYGDITEAPWYDPGYPPSTEFAGVVSLGLQGLDDSSAESSITEYITDGGNAGRIRSSTLSIVASVAIIASTERGAEFGKRWLDRRLRGVADSTTCAGFDLKYFRWAGANAPIAHHRNVKLTRGTSITRKRTTDCSTTWLLTFTLTAADPFEYSEPVASITHIGASTTASGPGVVNAGGTVSLVQSDCPVYDTSPVMSPLAPALVASPTVPNLLPDGWPITTGDTFQRWWAKVSPVEPTTSRVVPVFSLTGSNNTSGVRLSVWNYEDSNVDQCDPLWSAVIIYVPSGLTFTIDGEKQVSYVWDGASPVVRRADSVVFSTSGGPIDWTSFSNANGYLVTVDVLAADSGHVAGAIDVALSFVTKSE